MRFKRYLSSKTTSLPILSPHDHTASRLLSCYKSVSSHPHFTSETLLPSPSLAIHCARMGRYGLRVRAQS